MLEQYVYKDQKKLRCGYTTGSCAAAAAKAATAMLLSEEYVSNVSLLTPKGTTLDLQVLDIQRTGEQVTCAIQKDSGDDADVTNGIFIYASVMYRQDGITIEGGAGVGRVTKSGLDQPVGQAAINSVPRKMIQEAVLEEMDAHGYEGGIQVIISIPEGIEIAKRTFNPRLGIEGGISVLGTSGIVEPMSEQALVDTIRTEIKMQSANGNYNLLVTPGNYGADFLKDVLRIDIEKAMKCSNFIGDTIDMAYEYQIKSLLLVGHIGKLVKLGAGIMNTHSKMADGRMEILSSCAIRAGAEGETAKRILTCITTDEAIAILLDAQILEDTMAILMERIEFYLKHRAYEGMTIAAITFSNQYGILGCTSKAETLLQLQKN